MCFAPVGGLISFELDAVVVRILTFLRRKLRGDEENKSISSSSPLESTETVVDWVLDGRVLLILDLLGDSVNPLGLKPSRCLPAPGMIPVPEGRVGMRNDGSESMVRPEKESRRSTCSITSVLAWAFDNPRDSRRSEITRLFLSRDLRVAFWLPSHRNTGPSWPGQMDPQTVLKINLDTG
jgi:hypothetical protein